MNYSGLHKVLLLADCLIARRKALERLLDEVEEKGWRGLIVRIRYEQIEALVDAHYRAILNAPLLGEDEAKAWILERFSERDEQAPERASDDRREDR
jgi:hypothetical protein